MRAAEFRIPSLDGIRGVAALIVFVAHALFPRLVPGGFGVTIFFFLSGYLITTLLRMEYEQTGGISFSRFYLRRIYRILPPMYIVLIVVMLLALTGVMPHRMTAEAVFAQFAHLTNYYFVAVTPDNFVPATSVMWSLAVEEHFYLVFPVLLLLLLRRFDRNSVALALFGMCVVVLAWRTLLVFGMGVGAEYTYHATDTRLDSLLYGCIMGVWMNPALDQNRIRLSRNAGIGLFVLGCSLILFSLLYRNPTFRETLRYSVQGLGLFPIFFCAVRFAHWPIFSWLESKPMRWMGLFSYTFYLVHLPCLALVGRYTELDKYGRAALGFAAALLASALMYAAVERKMGALRRRLHESARRERSRAAAGVPTAG